MKANKLSLTSRRILKSQSAVQAGVQEYGLKSYTHVYGVVYTTAALVTNKRHSTSNSLYETALAYFTKSR